MREYESKYGVTGREKEKKYFRIAANQSPVGCLLKGNGGHMEKTIPVHGVEWI